MVRKNGVKEKRPSFFKVILPGYSTEQLVSMFNYINVFNFLHCVGFCCLPNAMSWFIFCFIYTILILVFQFFFCVLEEDSTAVLEAS